MCVRFRPVQIQKSLVAGGDYTRQLSHPSIRR